MGRGRAARRRRRRCCCEEEARSSSSPAAAAAACALPEGDGEVRRPSRRGLVAEGERGQRQGEDERAAAAS